TDALKCANCNGAHLAYSHKCPVAKKAHQQANAREIERVSNLMQANNKQYEEDCYRRHLPETYPGLQQYATVARPQFDSAPSLRPMTAAMPTCGSPDDGLCVPEHIVPLGTENNGTDNWEVDQYLAWAMADDSDPESKVFDLPLLAIGGVVNGAPAAASDLTAASAALFELTTAGPVSSNASADASASADVLSAAASASTTSNRGSISSAATLLLLGDEDEDVPGEFAMARERFPRILASFFCGDIDWLRSRHPGGLLSQDTFIRAFDRGAGLREVLEAENLHQDWLMGRNSNASDSEAYLAGPGARPTAWDEPAAMQPSNWEEHLSLVRYTASLRLWRLEDDLDLSSDYCFDSVEEDPSN
uniref:Nanos-type domain-containing protein n=1 Tax=Macrostomum lignano TaxID=282301 RepID=A0A1I8J4L2_9PLAT